MERYYVADGHCDFLFGAVQYGYEIGTHTGGQAMTLPRMQEGNVALQLFAAWIDTSFRTPPLQQCISMIDAYNRMLEQNERLIPFTSSFQPGKGKIATLLTVEGGEATEGSLAVLRVLYDLGVRAMMLTWNENNELAGAALAKGNKGLTSLGLEMIDEMNRIGMAIDVSHLSDRGIDDVLGRSRQPVFASHSNARDVFSSPRSLTDAQIRAIAAQGGVIGVNFYHKQLTPKRLASIEDIVAHIVHIAKVGGVDCCAIGSDFDGMQVYPTDLRDSRDFPALFAALEQAGFSHTEVEKIAYGNLTSYLGQFVQ